MYYFIYITEADYQRAFNVLCIILGALILACIAGTVAANYVTHRKEKKRFPSAEPVKKGIQTKVLLLVIISVATCTCRAQQTYSQLDIGYSTQTTNAIPVVALTFGRKFCSDDYLIAPLAEIGLRGHIDDTHNAFGHVSIGLQYKYKLSITAGYLYGGDQTKQDRHIMPDGDTILIHGGAESNNFNGIPVAIRLMHNLHKPEPGDHIRVQLVEQLTYAHKALYASVGFRLTLN